MFQSKILEFMGVRRGLLGPIALYAALFVGLAGCNSGDGSTSSDEPLPAVSGVQVKDAGTLPTNPDILGRGFAYSTEFQGRSVWVYGDTFLKTPDASGRTLISNSMSYTSDSDASDGIGGFQDYLDTSGAPAMLIPETPDEQQFNSDHLGDNCKTAPCGDRWALWPGAVVADPADGRALLFYLVVSDTAEGDFQSIGSSVATWSGLSAIPQRPNVAPVVVPGHPDIMFDGSEPAFGSAALMKDGLLYVYGCAIATDGLDKGCRLARVDPATVQDRSTWTFFGGGSSWSTSVSDAVPVFDGNDILSVSWNDYLGAYLAIYSAPFSGNDVVLRTAPSPEGPWSGEMHVFSAEGSVDGGTSFDAQAHAEYASDGGRIVYVTYSRQTSTAGAGEVRLLALNLSRAP